MGLWTVPGAAFDPVEEYEVHSPDASYADTFELMPEDTFATPIENASFAEST